MSKKKDKVVHVDKLIVHAKNVEIIRDHDRHHHDDKKKRETHEGRRDPWEFLWGRPRS